MSLERPGAQAWHGAAPDIMPVLRVGAASMNEQPGRGATMPTEAVALSIVSNSRLLREGLTAALSAHATVYLAGSYAAEPDAAGPLPNPSGHVVLLDGNSIGAEAALRWTRFWRGLAPPAAVLILELQDDAALIVDCIAAGAGGYTVRGASAGEVVEAILRVQQGTAACSPEVTARLFARLEALSATRTPMAPVGVPLTARELDVLRCIAADCSNQEIAEQLVLQLSTVKHHVHNILEKLNMRHRWDAVRLAVERGWLDGESPTHRTRART